jgi:HupE / UreJ protein
MKRLLLLLFAPFALQAHMVSLSTGEIRIEDQRGYYELRMPLYEVAHVRDPERTLFEHIRFSSGGSPAREVSRSCREDAEAGAYLCRAEYVFPEPALILDVECTLHAVTVPNHVHLLRAVNGKRTDQAVLDFSFTKTTLRFRAPTPYETATTQMGAGMMRAAGGAAQLLFLASLVLAARRRRELLALTGMFLAGEVASCLLLPITGWQPAPRFIEAAAALTIAYLAVEILLLPEAGMRWLVVGVLGAFHGLYFELFVRNSGYSALWVLTGVVLAEVLLIALFALIFSRIAKATEALRPVKVSASVLLVVGVAWFVLRLRG